MVMLGGQHPAARIEVHDIVFTAVEETLERKYAQLKSRWFGDKKHVHLDGWMRIAGIEEFRVELRQDSIHQPHQLYFFNLGGYSHQSFGEDHRYGVVIANSLEQAKYKAKRQAPELWQLPHKDNIVDIDQCLRIDKVGNWHVCLVKGEHQGITFENCYIPL